MAETVSVTKSSDRFGEDFDSSRWSCEWVSLWVTTKIFELNNRTPRLGNFPIPGRPELVEVLPYQFSPCSLFPCCVVEMTHEFHIRTSLSKLLTHPEALGQVREDGKVVTRLANWCDGLFHSNDE